MIVLQARSDKKNILHDANFLELLNFTWVEGFCVFVE